jgi:polyhydroxyalkanoate synthesis regulator phasin
MRKSIFVPVLIATAFFLTASATFGSEADELREKAKMAKQEAAELKKLGRTEESGKLARKAKELLEAAERLEEKGPKVSEEEIEKLQGRLKDLLDKQRRMKEARAPERDLAEIRERIVKTGRELDGLRGAFKRQVEGRKGPGPHPEMMVKLEEAGRRVKHLRIAAENLHAAGAADLAREIMEKAEAMEREAREAKMRTMEEAKHRGGPDMGGVPAQIDELRREVGRLREEMKELGQHVKQLERARK